MIKITKEDYKSRLTNRDEIKIDDMTEEQLKLYLSMYSVYMEWFINLLILKTNIKSIDDQLKKSNFKFKKVNNDDIDFYQKFSIEYLDYFYLRNNLYLYRLNKDEYLFIIDRIKNDNYGFDEEVEKFINNTYKKIIFEKVRDLKNVKINHDKIDVGRYVDNDSIIIGIKYDNNNGLNGKDWYDNLVFQEKEIKRVSQCLLENLHNYFSNNIVLLDF